jgi:hypothetical protein
MRLLGPYPAAEMECYPVSAMVNSPQSQGAGLIEPLNTSAVRCVEGRPVSIFFCDTHASCPSRRNV